MNEPLRVGEAVFAWVVQTSWQAGILALLILGAQKLFRRQLSPAWRYGLWILLVLRLVLPGMPRASWSIYNIAALPDALQTTERPSGLEPPGSPLLAQLPVAHGKVEAEPNDRLPRISQPPGVLASVTAKNPIRTAAVPWSWHRVVLFVWALGTAFFTARLAWSNVWFSHRVARESKEAHAPAMLLLRACQEELGLSSPVRLLETAHVHSPSVYGFWQKRLLLPEGTLRLFSADELRCIFLHELAHIKRRDLEVNWLVSLLQVVHWFNPVLWMAFARMRQDREIACDALALARLGTDLTEPYGETVIRVVGNLVQSTKAAGVLALSEDKRQLKERIRMIAAFGEKQGWPAFALVLAVGIAAVGLSNASRARTTAVPSPQNSAASALADSKDTFLPRGIHGRVIDPQGNPVTNANVRCQGFDWYTFTDSQGRFSWPGEERSRTFEIRKDGFQRLFTGLLVPSVQETILRMQRAPVIKGKVVDKETQQPVPEFEVFSVRLLQGPVSPTLNPREAIRGVAGRFQYSFDNTPWPDCALVIDAAGYEPVLSHLIAGDDGKELRFELVRTVPITGKVLTPAGAPASQAEVRVWCGELNLGDIPSRHLTASDRAGGFSLPSVLDGKLMVSHETGYAEVRWHDFLAGHRVQLSQWGHVKGRWPKPLPEDRQVSLARIQWSGELNSYTLPPPWRVSSAPIKSDGSFEFQEGIPPGQYMVTQWKGLRMDWLGGGYSMLGLASKRAHVAVEAGQTTFVEIPSGPAVVGKVDFGTELSLTNVHLPIVELRLKQSGPEFKFPALDPSLSVPENFERWKEYRERVLNYWLSEEGMARRRAERVFEIPTEPDGSFRIDNVPPGDYRLQINAQRWGGKSGSNIQREISISASTDGSPVNVGTLR